MLSGGTAKVHRWAENGAAFGDLKLQKKYPKDE